MSSVPVTRSLPYVLREALKDASSLKVLIGTVVATPDRAHVTVSIQGTNVTVPKLATYISPTVGEPVYILTDPLLTVALGAVSASIPPAPPLTNADTLDGLDSNAFIGLGTGLPNSRWRLGGVSHTATSSGPSGRTSVAHGLGQAPNYYVGTPVFPSQATLLGISADATNVYFDWSTINVSVAVSAILLYFK